MGSGGRRTRRPAYRSTFAPAVRRWPGPTTGRPGYAASNPTVAAYLDPKTITLTVFRLRYGEPDCSSATGSECAVLKRAHPNRRGSVRPVRCLAAGELPEAAEPEREHDLQRPIPREPCELCGLPRGVAQACADARFEIGS